MKSPIRRIFYLILLSVCLLSSQTYAQNAAPTHPVDGEYIKEWLVLGPFFPNALDKDFLASVGGEAKVHPKAGDTVTTTDGKSLTWKRYTSKGNIIDLLDAVGNHQNATAYAFCLLQSETGEDDPVFLGSDGGIAVWINGKQAHHNPVDRPLTLDEDSFEVKLKPGSNPCLLKVTQATGAWGFAMWAIPASRVAVISGIITDEQGKPIPNADIRLEQDGLEVKTTQTDASGSYRMWLSPVYPGRGLYDLSATSGELGDWQLGLHLHEGERKQIHLRLRPAISISGRVFAFDNSPHAALPVQAVGRRRAKGEGRNRKVNEASAGASPSHDEWVVIAGTLSDEGGQYQFINLKPGRYELRCQVMGGYVYYGMEERKDGRMEGNAPHSSFLQVQRGKTLSNLDFRLTPFKKGTWKTYNAVDGLANNLVTAIHQDKAGVLWFGTNGGGVSRYDGKGFVNFTTQDGLANNSVEAIHRDPDGVMWFGTAGGGVSQYDGITWQSLDTRDGLAGNNVFAIHPDSEGSLWFGTDRGITRFHRSKTKPLVHIVSVTTDQTYQDPSTIPSFSTGTRITLEYNAIDLNTIPEKRQYRIRIQEIDADWRPPTKATSFNHTFKKPGTYTFAVQAIDRDLNYSEPATLTLHVKRPWWVYALFGTIGVSIPLIAAGFYFGKRLQTQRAIAQQFNPYIAGRVVSSDLFYGRSDLITDIERTLANNCFLIYGERRIGKSSIQHQLKERLGKADDPTYKFIPAYIDLQGVAEEDFCRTIAAGVVEHAAGLFREPLTLRVNDTREGYTYRDLTRDLRTIIDHLKEGETKAIKLVLLMDEVDTLNTYSLRTNLNLRGLFMGPLKENLVLVMSGLYLKMDWSAEGGGSPPFNFLSREIQIQPLDEDSARKLITEPVKGFYTYEPKGIDLILSLSELRPFTIQGFCLRAVNRVLADSRTKITVADIEAIQDSVLAEVASIRGERAGTALPASFNEALSIITDLKAENARLRGEAA